MTGIVPNLKCVAGEPNSGSEPNRTPHNSEEWLRAILDSTHAYIGVLSADGVMLEANRSALGLDALGLDMNREGMVGRPFWETECFVHTKGASEKVRDAVQRASIGEFVSLELPLNTPDRGVAIFECLVHPVKDRNGNVTLIVPEARELTEYKRATETLRQRTAQFETLLNEAPIGVYLVDADFCIRETNPTARRFFGDIPNLIGRNFDEVIHIVWPKDRADELVKIFRRTLETGEPHFDPEVIHKRQDRQIVEYYESQVHRIPTLDGRYGVVRYFRDISAQVIARERLKLLIDELNHRVKNTLAAVQSIAVQTLRNATSLAEGRQGVEARLVALSTAHNVLTREHWEGANLCELASGAVFAYSSTDNKSRFDISGPNIKLLPKAVLALSMALHELATNAVKYGALSNETGRIKIHWSITPNHPQMFRFQWIESSGPQVEKPQRRGFGSRLIEQGLAQDISGKVELSFAPEGLICTIEAPIEEILTRDVISISTPDEARLSCGL
ncbi:MAG TPA: HWE histidine kinase domain-containing protein [Xanthobacteraceae bacterium]|jgi:PAS domain S-box-containing protein|nr:HWE histidine kinase domain-containing protein [Xanthobacteraceae bacterium]